MKIQKQTTKPQPSDTTSYRPPQQLLVPCPDCGCTVLRAVAMADGTIKDLDPPQMPLCERPHGCEQARALAYISHASRWNVVRIVAQQRGGAAIPKGDRHGTA